MKNALRVALATYACTACFNLRSFRYTAVRCQSNAECGTGEICDASGGCSTSAGGAAALISDVHGDLPDAAAPGGAYVRQALVIVGSNLESAEHVRLLGPALAQAFELTISDAQASSVTALLDSATAATIVGSQVQVQVVTRSAGTVTRDVSVLQGEPGPTGAAGTPGMNAAALSCAATAGIVVGQDTSGAWSQSCGAPVADPGALITYLTLAAPEHPVGHTGNTYGLYVTTAATSGADVAIGAVATATSGTATALFGVNAGSGYAVYGVGEGSGAAVVGQGLGNGRGVWAIGGAAEGLAAQSDHLYGVYGLTTNVDNSGFVAGVYGLNQNGSVGSGVLGQGRFGVLGLPAATGHDGVAGWALSATPNGTVAVHAISSSAGNTALKVDGSVDFTAAQLPVYVARAVNGVTVVAYCTATGVKVSAGGTANGIPMGGACQPNAGKTISSNCLTDASGACLNPGGANTPMVPGGGYSCTFSATDAANAVQVSCLRALGAY